MTTEALRKRLQCQSWTSHNIRLNDELTTWPNGADFFETDLRLKAIRRVFDLVFGPDLTGKRIADLGSLEGGFALAFAQAGARVIGIEARRTNFDKLELLRDHFALPHLEFVQADVKDFTADRFGLFDAVLALGILYHLDQPAQWLRQIAHATRRVLVVDTHFAPGDAHALSRLDPRLAALNDLETHRLAGANYSGRWFTEYAESADPEKNLWASYSNWRSFWLTKESLVRAIRDAGFPLVFEQQDYSADSFERFAFEFPRTLLIGIKPMTSVS